jgi:uncharacterized protein (TIGR02453 family)
VVKGSAIDAILSAVGDGFQGWPEKYQEFFIGLQLDNSKSYWEKHKKTYLEWVRKPMEDLLADLEPEFGPGKVFRPNRDIRFSADKSPYKTNISADMGMNGNGGYVSLDARGLLSAAGRYHLEPEHLATFRKAVADNASGRALVKITEHLESQGYEIGGQDLKRVPPGYPQDHPRARLLRHKRLYFWRHFGLVPWIGSAAAKERITQVWRDGAPLHEWFAKHLRE